MSLNKYYQKLVTYRDLIDRNVSKGIIDVTKASRLVEKLNDWYEQAKFLDKAHKVQQADKKGGK